MNIVFAGMMMMLHWSDGADDFARMITLVSGNREPRISCRFGCKCNICNVQTDTNTRTDKKKEVSTWRPLGCRVC